jgi:hypothetical protein
MVIDPPVGVPREMFVAVPGVTEAINVGVQRGVPVETPPKAGFEVSADRHKTRTLTNATRRIRRKRRFVFIPMLLMTGNAAIARGVIPPGTS